MLLAIQTQLHLQIVDIFVDKATLDLNDYSDTVGTLTAIIQMLKFY